MIAFNAKLVNFFLFVVVVGTTYLAGDFRIKYWISFIVQAELWELVGTLVNTEKQTDKNTGGLTDRDACRIHL